MVVNADQAAPSGWCNIITFYQEVIKLQKQIFLCNSFKKTMTKTTSNIDENPNLDAVVVITVLPPSVQFSSKFVYILIPHLTLCFCVSNAFEIVWLNI